MLGLSQKAVADGLGVTFQQVQKYENGANALTANRLLALSKLLKVPVGYFFEGLQVAAEGETRMGESTGMGDGEPASEREILEIVKTFVGIRDKGLRRRLADLMRAITHPAMSEQDCNLPPGNGRVENPLALRTATFAASQGETGEAALIVTATASDEPCYAEGQNENEIAKSHQIA